jgi:hypothetical protein
MEVEAKQVEDSQTVLEVLGILGSLGILVIWVFIYLQVFYLVLEI